MGPTRRWRTDSPTEIDLLAERYGKPIERQIEFPLTAPASTGPAGFPLSSPRTAEVVLVIPRLKGKVLVHTKHFYPSGVWRLPTGGLKRGERIEHAILREAAEETGNALQPKSFLYRISYVWEGASKEFSSFGFLMTEGDRPIESRDPREQITAFRDVDRQEMLRIVDRLENLGGSWRRWGLFRAAAHRILLQLWPESGNLEDLKKPPSTERRADD